ncbi:MAG: alpha/beta fold hydrolase [Alphaproteobacteria bacterium]|nr:alpha/beta fold hydrolase [Alphaproteobacteria bacterium]
MRPDWEREAPTWPHSAHSRFVRVEDARLHLQEIGDATAPCILLVHGTGASTHSFRRLMEVLAGRYRLVALDMPGHAFSERPGHGRLSLPAVAATLSTALTQEGISPDHAIGHSAGAAVLARMILDGGIAPKGLISLNGAFFPFKGLAGKLFPPMAKLLFRNPVVPWFLAGQAQRTRNVERLLQSQGDPLTPEDIDYYARLLRYPSHVSGVMGMMAQWDLKPLLKDLKRLPVPLHAVAGDRDRSVPPSDADALCRLVPNGTVHHLAGLGHLAHEQDPERIAKLVLSILQDDGL